MNLPPLPPPFDAAAMPPPPAIPGPVPKVKKIPGPAPKVKKRRVVKKDPDFVKPPPWTAEEMQRFKALLSREGAGR